MKIQSRTDTGENYGGGVSSFTKRNHVLCQIWLAPDVLPTEVVIIGFSKLRWYMIIVNIQIYIIDRNVRRLQYHRNMIMIMKICY